MSLLRHVCQAGWRVLILSLMCCDPGWIQFLHFPTHSIKGHTPGLPTNEGNAQRVWSLHATQPDTPKAHEDSGLSSSGPVHWDLAPCHLNLKASQNRKFSCLLPQMRLQDKLHAGYWASSSLSGIFQPQSHLDASWRLKPADPTLCNLSRSSHTLQSYLWAEKATGLHTGNVCSGSCREQIRPEVL